MLSRQYIGSSLSLSMATFWLDRSLYHRSLSQANTLAISFCIYPSLVTAALLRSPTLAYRVSTCNIKWVFEACQACTMPPSTLPQLTGQSSMMGLADDFENQVA